METTNTEQENPNAVLVGIKNAIDNYHRIPHSQHIPGGTPTEEEDTDAGGGAGE